MLHLLKTKEVVYIGYPVSGVVGGDNKTGGFLRRRASKKMRSCDRVVCNKASLTESLSSSDLMKAKNISFIDSVR